MTVCFFIVSLSIGYSRAAYASGETQIVSANTLTSAAFVTIRDRAGVSADSDDLKITVLGYPRDLDLPAGALTLAVDLPYGIRYNVPTTANVTVNVDGTTITVVTLKFQVKLYQQVVVAARSISNGDILSTDNLSYSRMDVGRLNSGYYTGIDKLLGLISRRNMTTGTAINQYMISKPTVVKRGNAVKVIARVGGIEVTTVGQAMQDGYEGQLIKVQNVNSGKILSAKVLDTGSVEVITYKP